MRASIRLEKQTSRKAIETRRTSLRFELRVLVRETDPAERQLRRSPSITLMVSAVSVRETDPAERQLRPGPWTGCGCRASSTDVRETDPAERQLRHTLALLLFPTRKRVRETDPAERQLRLVSAAR